MPLGSSGGREHRRACYRAQSQKRIFGKTRQRQDKPGIDAQFYNPSTGVEVGMKQDFWEFQASLSYVVSPCLKRKQKKGKNRHMNQEMQLE